VRLSESEVATARSLEALREEQLERTVRQLEILLGRYPAGEVDSQVGLPVLSSSPAAGLPSQLLQRRPDLRAAELRLLASDERLYEARALLWPDLRLTGSAGRTSSELGDLLDSDFDVWSIGASLFQPIFQGGRLKANVALAEAQLREILELYAGDVLRAFAEVEILLAIEGALATQEAEQRMAAERAEEAYDLAQGRYAAGREEITALLIAQRRAIEAETSLLDVQRRRLDARVDLFLALGGGFDLQLPTATAEAENEDRPAPDAEANRGESG